MQIADSFRLKIQRAKDPLTRAVFEFLLDRTDNDHTAFGCLNLPLFHGSPVEMIDIMLEDGLRGQEHEILGGEWLCVSPNDNVLQYFSDGGTNGLAATDGVELRNCLFLTPRHIDFFLEICTADRGKHSDATELWFENRGIDYCNLSSWDLERIWRHLPQEIEAFVWPDCHKFLIEHYGWSGTYNLEAEISLTPAGCRAFERSITQIIRNGEWFERPETVQLSIPQLRYAA